MCSAKSSITNTFAFFIRLSLLLASVTFSVNALAQSQIVNPSAGSTLSDSAQKFSWTIDNADVERVWLYVGTTEGGRDIANSGDLGLDTEYDVIGIPLDGSTIHARFWYYIATRWFYIDSSFTAADIDVEISTPAIDSPANNSELAGASVEFKWSNNNTPVTYWWLYLGSIKGAKDIYDSGRAIRNLSSVTVDKLPIDGSTVHGRLWYRTAADGWKYVDSLYRASSDPGPAGSLVEVVAVGQQAGDQVHLEINSKQVATFDLPLASGDFSGTAPGYQIFSYSHSERIDTAEIRIDMSDSVGDVRVREVRVDGQVYATAATTAYKSGHRIDGECRNGDFEAEVIHCSGSIEYHIDNRFDSLVEIVAVGRQGGEKIQLEIDGQLVASFDDLSSAGSAFAESPAFDTYTYVHPTRLGSATLRVAAPGQPADVRIREVRVDGNVYSANSAEDWQFNIDNGSGPARRPTHVHAGVTSGRWIEINAQRQLFNDQNQCQAKVELIAESPDVLIDSGDVAGLQQAVNDGIQAIGLRGGTYQINDTIRLRNGQQLLGTNGETVVIDASLVDQAFQLYTGSTMANLSIMDARDSAVYLYNDSLLYRVSAGRTGYRGYENPNGTSIGVANGGQNNCIVSVDAFEGYNEISYDGSSCTSCADGGNADGIGIKFDAVNNTVIDAHAYRNSDDGIDFWKAGTKTSDTLDSTHYIYKTKAFDNNSNGFDRNGNTYEPQLFETEASGNGGSDYAGF